MTGVFHLTSTVLEQSEAIEYSEYTSTCPTYLQNPPNFLDIVDRDSL